jgi:hypothetical protein
LEIVDPTPAILIVMTSFPKADCIFLPYEDKTLTEELPAHMPKPFRPSMTMICGQPTGFIVFFLNNAPIYWSSKKQNSFETATFGSEFVAMKQVCVLLEVCTTSSY